MRRARTAGSTWRTGQAGRPGPAGPASAGSRGSGPSAAVSPRVRRPRERRQGPPRRFPGRCHGRAGSCGTGYGPRAGRSQTGDPARAEMPLQQEPSARGGEFRHAVARLELARPGAATLGTVQCRRVAARPGLGRPGMATLGTVRCRRVTARPGLERLWMAVPGTARCRRAAARHAVARCDVGAPGMAQSARAAARHRVTQHAEARRGVALPVTARHASACPQAAASRRGTARHPVAPPDVAVRGMARWRVRAAGQGSPLGPHCRQPLGMNRDRLAVRMSRDRLGWHAGAGPRPGAGHALVSRATAEPTGRAPARHDAHPLNPWRERTAHPCSEVRFRAT